MKTLKLNYFPFLLLGLMSFPSIGQQEGNRLWVTIENEADVPVLVEGRLTSRNETIQQLINEYSILHVDQALPSSRNPKLQKVYEVECWCDGEQLSEQMSKTPGLADPERAPEYELLSDPNDYSTVFSNDYALNLINAKSAWDYSTGDSTIIIGVSDGNFYTNHEELVNKFVYLDAPFSYNTMNYYHGTAVATTAAGNTDNAIGKSSIGYDCKLALATMSYNKLLNLSYAGSRVLNISWTSGCWYSSYIQSIIDEIYNNGTIIVAAAGNGGTCGGPTKLVYPAACERVIAVSSVGPQDNHERTIGNPGTTHQHNSSVDICAPGYDVALTVAPGWYLTGNGTSFAAPYVSGTIGLMLSLRPCLTFEDVLSILQSTATNIDAMNPNYVGTLGAGRMDAGLALQMVSGMNCGDDGNNGHGNDNGHFDPSNPGLGNGGNGGNGNGGNNGNNPNVVNGNGPQATGSQGSQRNGNPGFDTKEIDVKLYPNPTEETSKITWDFNQAMTLRVTRINGSIVYEEAISPETNSTKIAVEDKGVYFVQMMSEGQNIWTGKLIKM